MNKKALDKDVKITMILHALSRIFVFICVAFLSQTSMTVQALVCIFAFTNFAIGVFLIFKKVNERQPFEYLINVMATFFDLLIFLMWISKIQIGT